MLFFSIDIRKSTFLALVKPLLFIYLKVLSTIGGTSYQKEGIKVRENSEFIDTLLLYEKME